MPRFRKKPVEIEAMQVMDDLAAVRNVVRWMQSGGANVSEPFLPSDEHVLSVLTLEGEMRAGVGDWIIRGVQGEFYPCKDAIFAATYEPV